MAEAAHVHARPVRLVSVDGELVGDGCSGCVALSKELVKKAAKITELQNAEAERLGTAADSKQIMEVLTFHKQLFGGRIVRGKAAWKAVKARFADIDAETERPAFTTLHLRAASLGLKLSDWRGRKKLTGAAWLFADPDRVQEFIETCTTFKRETGVSALELVDELAGPHLVKLAARCSCGHHRLDHEKERPELDLWDPPCAVHGCCCTSFSDFDYRVEQFMAGRERMGQ